MTNKEERYRELVKSGRTPIELLQWLIHEVTNMATTLHIEDPKYKASYGQRPPIKYDGSGYMNYLVDIDVVYKILKEELEKNRDNKI